MPARTGARRQAVFARPAAAGPQAILLSQMVVPPSAPRLVLIQAFYTSVSDLVARCDGLWFMAGADAQVSKLDWSGNRKNLTPVGVTDDSNFTADRGWLGNGTTFGLRTGLIPGNGLAHYGVNGFSFGGAIQDPNGTTNAVRYIGGVSLTGFGRFWINPGGSGANQVTLRSNTTATQTATSTITAAHWAISRPSSTAYSWYKNGAVVTTYSSSVVAAAVTPDAEMYLQCAGSTGGTAAGTFSVTRTSFTWLGDTFSDAEITRMYNAAHAYLQGVGAE